MATAIRRKFQLTAPQGADFRPFLLHSLVRTFQLTAPQGADKEGLSTEQYKYIFQLTAPQGTDYDQVTDTYAPVISTHNPARG